MEVSAINEFLKFSKIKNRGSFSKLALINAELLTYSL